jgi:hypothetical protein
MSIAVAVGVSVFAAMLVGVGGYQAVASHTIGAFLLGVDPKPGVAAIGTPAGSALSMCGLPSSVSSDASFITVHSSSWRHTSGSGSGHSPAGLVSDCN